MTIQGMQNMFKAAFMWFGYLGIGCGGEGCSTKGWVHNLLMQFFTLDISKFEVLETHFSDTIIT